MVRELYVHKAVTENETKMPENDNFSAFKLHFPDSPAFF